MRLFLALRFDKKMNKALTSTLHDLKANGVTGNYTPAQKDAKRKDLIRDELYHNGFRCTL